MNDKIKSTLIIGIEIVCTGFLLGKSFKDRNANLDSISVIGLGTKDFVSDEILWSGSLPPIVSILKWRITKSYLIKKSFLIFL